MTESGSLRLYYVQWHNDAYAGESWVFAEDSNVAKNLLTKRLAKEGFRDPYYLNASYESSGEARLLNFDWWDPSSGAV